VFNLRSRYLPELYDSVDLAHYMGIGQLTIHLWIDSRFVSSVAIAEKLRILRELTNYANKKKVVIGLENLSEKAEDLEKAVLEAPDLRLTLDVGHGQLLSRVNRSFEILERLADFVVELHVHDNMGGSGPADDLHLPVGEGVIDFQTIIEKAVERGFQGDVVVEVGLDDLPESMNKIRSMWALANDKYS
jgi:sugar phosphate isomerase/epimerase